MIEFWTWRGFDIWVYWVYPKLEAVAMMLQ